LLTVDEFLKLLEVEGEKMELIHGEVVDMPRNREIELY
jgi:Uma2 family endonuclease